MLEEEQFMTDPLSPVVDTSTVETPIVETPVQAQPQSTPQGKPEESKPPVERTVSVGDDEYPVDEKGFIQIPATAFKKRLNRYSKNQLREAFGTDDIADLKARLDEHGNLKAKSEKERLATLAKEERLSEELAKERNARTLAETKAAKLVEDREYQAADTEVRSTAEQYIKPGKMAKLAVYEFGEYVRELDDDEADALKPKDVKAWFEKYAKENPELALGSKPEKKTERKPISHGAGDQESPPPMPISGGKTARPGQPNSMTDEEYRAYKASLGIRS